tara:strand:- start:618 stop:848 length:231 start_codon:yes stop_codon:yes gene_type:complete
MKITGRRGSHGNDLILLFFGLSKIIESRKAIEKIGATTYLDADVGNILYILRFEGLKLINIGVIDEIEKNRYMENS